MDDLAGGSDRLHRPQTAVAASDGMHEDPPLTRAHFAARRAWPAAGEPVGAAGLVAPGAVASGLGAPGAVASGLGAPGLAAPGSGAPGIVAPDFVAPDFVAPRVIELPDPVGAGADASPLQPLAAHRPSRATRRPWVRRYRLAVLLVDALCATAAALTAITLRFGELSTGSGSDHAAWIAVLPVLWVSVVSLSHGYDSRVIGVGAEEFQRVWRAVIYLTAALAVGVFLTKTGVARGFVGVIVPLLLCYTTLGRYAARRVVHRLRKRRGVAVTRVLVLGDAQHAVDLVKEMRRDAYAGLFPVAVSLTTAGSNAQDALAELDALGVPAIGDPDDLLATLGGTDADAVAVTASHGLGAQKLRWISWQLEGTGVDLMVAPGLVEVAGRRLHVRPLSVVPLLQVEAPRFSGGSRLIKTLFDRVSAVLALVGLAPLLIVIGVLVRATSRGPALFRQTRIGRDGEPFTMYKFRSMYADAEHRLPELLHANEQDGLLFKIRQDPRVTAVGRVLRKYSLDELPQLLNVVTGSMSLVGPRPPLPREVEQYGDDVRRRLLVKPGVTGLWQISGRSNLTWEESVRLDLRYVENWSLAADIQIVWKTFAAVLRSSGAY